MHSSVRDTAHAAMRTPIGAWRGIPRCTVPDALSPPSADDRQRTSASGWRTSMWSAPRPTRRRSSARRRKSRASRLLSCNTLSYPILPYPCAVQRVGECTDGRYIAQFPDAIAHVCTLTLHVSGTVHGTYAHRRIHAALPRKATFTISTTSGSCRASSASSTSTSARSTSCDSAPRPAVRVT